MKFDAIALLDSALAIDQILQCDYSYDHSPK
jgi:hypothetical protein